MRSNPSSPRNLTLSLQPGLPPGFAEQVLESETDLDLDCAISTILKLMELYSVSLT